MVHVLDLQFQASHTIAAFLVGTNEGPVLVECGPYSTFPALIKGINRVGFRASDIRAVLLTHIHLDHAGSAWALAELGAQIYVHPKGYNHLLDPYKLLSSAQRIYGDEMDNLWGMLKPIAASQLHSIGDGTQLTFGDTTFTAWHTPGHAYHHIAWQLGNVVFTGDVGGVSIEGGPVQPPCPPPDIDVPAWKKSLQLLRQLNPDRLYLTHFGARDNVSLHLDTLERELDMWSKWVRDHILERFELQKLIEPFSAMIAKRLMDAGADDDLINRYNWANPSFMSVLGLGRYWKKHGAMQDKMAEQAANLLE